MELQTHGRKRYPTSAIPRSSAGLRSLMQTQRQEHLRYPSTTLLKSSNELGWSTLTAELLSHSRYEGPGAAAPADAEVALLVRGSDEGLLTYKLAGSWQSARPTTGSFRLRPIGRTDDEARICSPNVEALHLYVPTVAFAPLMDDYNLPPVPGRCIRYSWDVQDELINQIGLSVLSEMMSPTAAGRMLVETSSLLLAARLAHSHLETELIRLPIQSQHGLDDARLRRVLAYVEAHLAEGITVADLALSRSRRQRRLSCKAKRRRFIPRGQTNDRSDLAQSYWGGGQRDYDHRPYSEGDAFIPANAAVS